MKHEMPVFVVTRELLFEYAMEGGGRSLKISMAAMAHAKIALSGA